MNPGDTGGFRIPLVDVMAVLAGEAWDVRVPGSDEVAGTARLSASGKAINVTIAAVLIHHTGAIGSPNPFWGAAEGTAVCREGIDATNCSITP